MSTQKFMPELADQADRLQMLTESAESISKEDYYADLTPAQLDQKNEEFALNASKLNKIELEKKDAVDGFKARMKPLEIIYNSLLEEITIGKEKRTGQLFVIRDNETSMMLTYDENGDLVSSRRQTPEEKKGQSRMFIPGGFQARKAAND